MSTETPREAQINTDLHDPVVKQSSSYRSERAMSRVQSQVVAYLPSLRTILQRLRASSSTPFSLSSTLTPPLTHTTTTTAGSTSDTTSVATYSDALSKPDLVALQAHPQLPLPGRMGVALPSATSTAPSDDDTSAMVTSISTVADYPTVECLAQDCPEGLHSGFMLLFPGVSAISQLTVITLSEHTINDMTGWSSAIEEEREQLLEHFVDSAKEICSRLSAAGNWADFIDPSSGRAFYTTAYSSATLFETDDRFQQLGFDILDLGCCKCIRHPLWGSHAFVGTIFTDAPTRSPAIQSIMQL